MADRTKIQINPGEIFVGGTPPAGGSDPTDPTAGTPTALNTMESGFSAPSSGGTSVGFTYGPATLTYRPTYYMVETEQAMAEVVAVPVSEEASLAFTMIEAGYQNYATALGQVATLVDPGVSEAIFVGSKSVLTTSVVVLCSRKRSGTGYYLLTIYGGYSSEGAPINFERRQEQRMATTMRALADVDRPEGDQLFQLVSFAANPA